MAVIQLSNPSNPSAIFPRLPQNGFAITPADADTFSHPVSVTAGGAGTVRVIPWAGSSTVDVVLAAGGTVPFECKAVYDTGTDATSLVGTY